MGAFPWYKHYPDKFIRGVNGIGPDLIGCYIVVLDLIYVWGEPLPADGRLVGAILGVDGRRARTIIAKLERLGLVTYIESDGRLWAPIVDEWPRGRGKERIPERLRREVLSRDGLICVYCGTKGGPFHVDHIIAEACGGQTAVENLVVACSSCNLSKGKMDIGSWLGRDG